MKKILKLTLLILLIIFIGALATPLYVNSNSFAALIKRKISKELGNDINFEKHKIQLNGTIALTDFSLLALDKTEFLRIPSIKVKFNWSDLFNSDYLPQTISVTDAKLTANIADSKWPLHLLNKQQKPTPLPNLDLNMDLCNIDLEKLDAKAKKYNLKLTIKKVTSKLIQPLYDIEATGEVSPNLIKVTDLMLNNLGGKLSSKFTAWLPPQRKLELTLRTTSIQIEQALKYIDIKGTVIQGELDSLSHLTFNSPNDFTIKGEVSTSELLAKGDEIDEILNLIKKSNKNLVFKNSSATFNITPQALQFDSFRFENDEFISILADHTQVNLNKDLKPESFTIPLKIRAPYEVIKWKDYLMEDNPKLIEIPLDLSGKVSDIESILFKSLTSTIQDNSIEQGISKLEKKLNIKIDSKQVKDLLNSIDLEPIKKQVKKIDKQQLSDIIDSFEKDSKKREKVKKQIDSFLKFLE